MFFVFGTTIELTFVLFAKRIVDLNSKTTIPIDKGGKQECNASSNRAIVRIGRKNIIAFEEKDANDSPENDNKNKCPGMLQFWQHMSIMDKIDLSAFIFFTISYLTFDMIYFLAYI